MTLAVSTAAAVMLAACALVVGVVAGMVLSWVLDGEVLPDTYFADHEPHPDVPVVGDALSVPDVALPGPPARGPAFDPKARQARQRQERGRRR